nr:hypothetical protein HmN_000016200 [Hymenolepis microstoma]
MIKNADFLYLHYSRVRGSSPWRPDASMSTAHHENHNASIGFLWAAVCLVFDLTVTLTAQSVSGSGSILGSDSVACLGCLRYRAVVDELPDPS